MGRAWLVLDLQPQESPLDWIRDITASGKPHTEEKGHWINVHMKESHSLQLCLSTVALESIDRGSDSAPLDLFWKPVQSYLHPQDPSTQARALPSSPIKGYMEVTSTVFMA